MTWLRKEKLLLIACEKKTLNNLKILSPAFSGGRIAERNLHLPTRRSTVQYVC